MLVIGSIPNFEFITTMRIKERKKPQKRGNKLKRKYERNCMVSNIYAFSALTALTALLKWHFSIGFCMHGVVTKNFLK